ncbi:MAG: hypothetical protein ABW022_28340 [Actinoplanes sp.]
MRSATIDTHAPPDPGGTDMAQDDTVDLAVAAYREEGVWQLAELPDVVGEDVDELVAALRAARTSAFAGGDVPPPPTVQVPRRPLLWWAAWAVTVAGAVALFGH